MSEQTNNKEKAATDIIQVGSEIAGGLGGLAIGVLGGPIVGAAAQPILARALRAAAEFAQRQLSHREKVRVGATIAFAIAKIEQNKALGRKIRQDTFFHEQPDNRMPADEITEGVLLVAQREHQEKKLKFYGNLLGNIAFDPNISQSLANQLLRKAEAFSYQQLCLLTIFRRKQEFPHFPSHMNINNMPRMGIREDLYDLFQQGMFDREQRSPDAAVKGLAIDLTQFGVTFHDLMELHDIGTAELEEIITIMGKHT